MDQASRVLEAAVWSAVDGIATEEQLALLEADAPGWRRTLERLLDDTEDNLEAVRRIDGAERSQVIADVEAELARLEAAYDRLTTTNDPASAVLVVLLANFRVVWIAPIALFFAAIQVGSTQLSLRLSIDSSRTSSTRPRPATA